MGPVAPRHPRWQQLRGDGDGDGALAGSCSAVLRALHLIEGLGPAVGLHVNLAKC